MRHSLLTDLINKLLSYLSSKPYAEVHELVKSIQADAQPVDAPPSAPSEPSSGA